LISAWVINSSSATMSPLPPADPQYTALRKLAPHLAPQALQMALATLRRLQNSGVHVRTDVLTVIDYTKPSTDRRLWVFDLLHSRVVFQELAAHGKNSATTWLSGSLTSPIAS
jgi:hypothetical protein